MFDISRQNILTLSVLFLVFSLLSPWFVMVGNTSSDYHKNLDKEDDSMSTQLTIKESYYLDKVVVHERAEEGKETFFGILIIH